MPESSSFKPDGFLGPDQEASTFRRGLKNTRNRTRLVLF